MARDYAKRAQSRRRSNSTRRKPASRRRTDKKKANNRGNGLKIYLAGVVTGLFAAGLVYLKTLPPVDAPPPAADATDAEPKPPPKPRIDFYSQLRNKRVEVETPVVEPAATVARIPGNTANKAEVYILQAGSFRQSEDADRRRAELLLLGLEPNIEQTSGDNGRWFRVYVGPFETRSAMSKARGLTASQGIETLLLKRPID